MTILSVVDDLKRLVEARQSTRLLRLSFPNDNGPDCEFLVNALEADEGLSRDFVFKVEILSDNPAIALKEIQGKMLCVELVQKGGTLRYFTGYCFSFSKKKSDGSVTYYEAELGPWLRYLKSRKDSFIFHDATLYEQTQTILGEYAHADWDLQLHGSDLPMTMAVQFNESQYNYLHRRWEAAGWFYTYTHSPTGHKLILSDDSTTALEIDGGAEIQFQRHGGSEEEGAIGEWSQVRRFTPSSVALTKFDFKTPKPREAVLPTVSEQGNVPQIESYEYTGAYGFKNSEDGERLARLRMEEMEAAGKHFEAVGNTSRCMPFRSFKLTGHFDGDFLDSDEQAREFLIVNVKHSASNNFHLTGAPSSHYESRFTCIRKIIPWRPGRGFNSREAKVYGLQTALVVGPPGEEIFTDEYGRIRVQFHWDRKGKLDDGSSAWLRVITAWAGTQFGMVSIPRIGAEVVVMFFDGNADHGLVIGMVPNADMMPPWELPLNRTQSGILSRSTPGGTYEHSNALRFEDKKGHEQLWLHAEKDQLTEVENDETKWVGNDRSKTIDRDEVSHIKRDRTETVDHDETITVHNDRFEQVDRNETIGIGGNRSKTIGKNRKDDIGKNWSTYVARFKTETIGMAYMQNVGMGRMENVGLAYNLNVGTMMATVVGMNQMTKVGKKISINAGDELSITVGKASLVMKSDGAISINGHSLSVGTSGGQTFQADDNITLKAKKIQEN